MRVVWLGLGMRVQIPLDRMIGYSYRSRLTIELEEHGACTILVQVADGQVADNQRLARFDLDGDLFADL